MTDTNVPGSDLPFTGGAETAVVFDRAIDRLVRFHPEVVDVATTLVTDHAHAPMSHALMAELSLISSDAADLPAVRDCLAAMDATGALHPREQAHRDAIAAWLAGDWLGAVAALNALLIEWPTDLPALAIAHQLDFFLADAAELRDRPARTLARLDPTHPHRGFVAGMHAFGLEESGHYTMAEAVGRAAVEANPDDVWGVHAVAHTYEMLGRVDDGIEFMEHRRDDWGQGNLFTVHNWWHLALYYLDQARHDDVLAIYDERIHHADSAGVPLEMLDASALLARLAIDGIDTDGRFGPLADAWSTRVTEAPWYPFNDYHAVIAMAGAGRLDDARAVVARLEHTAAEPPDPSRTRRMMAADVGLPVSRAAIAYFDGDHDTVVDTLLPIRRIFGRFGGSHAQRDLPARMLVQSAIASGRHRLALALLDERLALRPSSGFARPRRDEVAVQLLAG